MTDVHSDYVARLLPQDFQAAEKHIPSVAGLPEQERELLIRPLAGRHAALGPLLFGMTLGTQRPRHAWEQAIVDRWRLQLTDQEMAQREAAVRKEPLTEAMLDIYYADRRLNISHYYSIFASAHEVLDSFRRRGYQRGAIDPVSWHAREALRPTSLLPSHALSIEEWALECRVARGLPHATAKFMTRASGLQLCLLFLKTVPDLWFKLLDQGKPWGVPVTERKLAVYQFLERYDNKYPGPDELDSYLLQEVTIMKQELRKSGPPPFWYRGLPTSDDSSKEKNTSNSDETAKATSRRPVLSNWAFGYDAGKQQWWLFHRKQGQWQSRKSVSIPTGFQREAMMVFAEHNGRVARADLLPLVTRTTTVVKKTKPGDSLDQGLSRLRRTLSALIPGNSESLGNKTPDPLPLYPNDMYIAAVQIGWAEPDELASGSMRFRLQDEV